MVRVRDDALRATMLALLARDPPQLARQYYTKCMKYVLLWLALNTRLNAVARTVLSWLHIDHQKLGVAAVRSFAGKPLITALRHRPCAALEGAVRRRRTTGVADESMQCVATLRFSSLSGVVVPGVQCSFLHFWLYPILVDPSLRTVTVAALRAAGIDAASDSTQLCSLGGASAVATTIAAGVIYLPVHRLCSCDNIAHIATVLERCGGGARCGGGGGEASEGDEEGSEGD